jgi:hypothetical protein
LCLAYQIEDHEKTPFLLNTKKHSKIAVKRQSFITPQTKNSTRKQKTCGNLNVFQFHFNSKHS